MLEVNVDEARKEVKIIDTNFLSYKYKQVKEFRSVDITHAIIPSIVAIEFLNNQSPFPMKANYYIPNIKPQGFGMDHIQFLVRRDHPFNKHRSDSISFDFKEDFESFKIYNNFSISNVVNEKTKELYKASVKFLSKEKRKELLKRYNFAIANKITCSPIVDSDIVVAYDLLDKIIQNRIINVKHDFKNSWNDILILSKAISSKGQLITSDKELNRFAAEVYNGKIQNANMILEISFESPSEEKKNKAPESKGYINKGWDYKMRK